MRRLPTATKVLAAAMAAFLLAGCTQLASNALQDYNDLRDMTRAYVGEQVRYRVLIRESCWQMVLNEARTLEARGDTAAARTLLAEAYPPLITVEAITKGDPKTALGTINDARICGVAGAARPVPETRPD